METASKTINWRNLIVSEGNADMGRTLGDMLTEYAAGDNDCLDRVKLATDGSIDSWEQLFISAPGEDPEWDTPRVPVDWDGFESALQIARGGRKVYALTERNNKDRIDPIIDVFTTRATAETYRAECGYGEIEEFDSAADARGDQ
jgi:hypothetical protein